MLPQANSIQVVSEIKFHYKSNIRQLSQQRAWEMIKNLGTANEYRWKWNISLGAEEIFEL